MLDSDEQLVNLPPKSMRFGGQHYLDDNDFIQSTKDYIDWIQEYKKIDETTKILDIGGGPGRFPIGLLHHVGNINWFKGIDVHNPSVIWCKNNISTKYTNFDFEYVDIYNERYNKQGNVKLDETFKFNLDSNEFDIIHLYSVFSHLIMDDISAYLKEFKRVIKSGGVMFLTAFVERDIDEEMIINPANFGPLNWSGPLHCVLYDYDYFLEVLDFYHFDVLDTKWKQASDEQTMFLLKWD